MNFIKPETERQPLPPSGTLSYGGHSYVLTPLSVGIIQNADKTVGEIASLYGLDVHELDRKIDTLIMMFSRLSSWSFAELAKHLKLAQPPVARNFGLV